MFNVETHVCSGHVFSTLPERNLLLPAPSDPQMCDVCCKVCSVNTQLGAGCGVNYLSLGGLRLTQDQILVSNILSVSGTMIMRILVGPFGDKHGVRRTYAALLVNPERPWLSRRNDR